MRFVQQQIKVKPLGSATQVVSALRRNVFDICRMEDTSPRTRGNSKSNDEGGNDRDRACLHYVHRCKLLAPCCGAWVGCRLCHDEAECCPTKLDRRNVQSVECIKCGTRQPVAESCGKCGVKFANYFCALCRHYDDDTSKGQFHCEGCGLCRVGGRENFFHCFKCGCCYSNSLKEEHHCIENNMHSRCPICFEDLFDSVKPLSVVKCGHVIHEECLDGLRQHGSVKCPICCKSMFEMGSYWDELNALVDASPENLSEFTFNVFCNDCLKVSRGVRLHAYGLRCEEENCRSFNVRTE